MSKGGTTPQELLCTLSITAVLLTLAGSSLGERRSVVEPDGPPGALVEVERFRRLKIDAHYPADWRSQNTTEPEVC